MFIRPSHYLWDAGIFDEVAIHNCYRLPEWFGGEDVIIDLGAHIGSFMYACMAREAEQVICVESDERNYAKLTENANRFRDQVVTIFSAAWRSDVEPTKLSMAAYDQQDPEANTGGGTCCYETAGPFVGTISLDEIIKRVGKSIRLLKLDIEGCEYPVLYTSSMLSSIQQITMEYHGIGYMRSDGLTNRQNNASEMAQFLRDQHFHVFISPTSETTGYMMALNKAWV